MAKGDLEEGFAVRSAKFKAGMGSLRLDLTRSAESCVSGGRFSGKGSKVMEAALERFPELFRADRLSELFPADFNDTSLEVLCGFSWRRRSSMVLL
mmetsp:Transcript_84439/g.149384  ORF Transcript_84439/g.149384 Transcript_84439/m.149384 type:complete len:96 (+) Transcript_84439:197-484(+)